MTSLHPQAGARGVGVDKSDFITESCKVIIIAGQAVSEDTEGVLYAELAADPSIQLPILFPPRSDYFVQSGCCQTAEVTLSEIHPAYGNFCQKPSDALLLVNAVQMTPVLASLPVTAMENSLQRPRM